MKDRRIIESWEKLVPSPEAKQRMLQTIRQASYAAPASRRGTWLRYGMVCCAVLLAAASFTLFSFTQTEQRSPLPASSQEATQTVSAGTSDREAAYSLESQAAAQAEQDNFLAAAEDRIQVVPLSQLAQSSSLILHGKVSGTSEPFTAQTADGTLLHLTDYLIQPLDTLRGDLQGAPWVSVRIAANSEDMAFHLQADAEYVLFLQRPSYETGVPLNTGGAYELTCTDAGALEKQEDGQFGGFSLEKLGEAAAFYAYEEELSSENPNSQSYTILDAAVGLTDNDPRLALPRSNRMNARYLNKIPSDAPRRHFIAELVPWEEEDRAAFFAQPDQEAVLGTVETVRQIEVFSDEYPENKSYRTVLGLRVERTLRGNASEGTLVSVLLPQILYGDPQEKNEGADPMYWLEEGVRGIFPVEKTQDGDLLGHAEDDGDSDTPRLYLRDLADYTLDDPCRGLVVEAGGSLHYLADYPRSKSNLSLEEFAAYLQPYLSA